MSSYPAVKRWLNIMINSWLNKSIVWQGCKLDITIQSRGLKKVGSY